MRRIIATLALLLAWPAAAQTKINLTDPLQVKGMTLGCIAFGGGSGGPLSMTCTQLFWDSSNNRLVIGGTPPSAAKVSIYNDAASHPALYVIGASGQTVSILVVDDSTGNHWLSVGANGTVSIPKLTSITSISGVYSVFQPTDTSLTTPTLNVYRAGPSSVEPGIAWADDNGTPFGWTTAQGNVDLMGIAAASEVTNESGTGTTANRTVKLTGAPSTAIVAGTGDTTGLLGICIEGCTTTGKALIAVAGRASCAFDGATTAGHYVQASTTTGGKCHDAGGIYPTSSQILGRILSTNGSSGTYSVLLFGAEISPTTAAGTASTAAASDHSITPCGSNLFVTGLSTAWALTCTQPAFSNLTGTIAAGQIGSGIIDLTTKVTGVLPMVNGGTDQSTAPTDDVLLGGGTGWLLKAMPSCADTAGNHLNFASHAFSCGTSGGGGGGTNPVVARDTFTCNSSTTAWTASGTPVSGGTILVSLNGLDKPTTYYSVASSTLTISPACATGSLVTWTYYTTNATGATPNRESFTSSGTTDFVLAHVPTSIPVVDRNGVNQTATAWSLISTQTIRFASSVPSGQTVNVAYTY